MAEGLVKHPGGQTGDRKVGGGRNGATRARVVGVAVDVPKEGPEGNHLGPGQLPWARLDLSPLATPGAQSTCPVAGPPNPEPRSWHPRYPSNCSD